MKRQPASSDGTKREALSIEEAANLLGVGRNTAYAAAKSGELPNIRIGGRILVPRVQLDELLEGKR